jgi:hypothetical protein
LAGSLTLQLNCEEIALFSQSSSSSQQQQQQLHLHQQQQQLYLHQQQLQWPMRKRLVFDLGATLYIGQAGPRFKGAFEVGLELLITWYITHSVIIASFREFYKS